jgi:hypothetical protein
LFAELKTVELAQQLCAATVVTYQQREPHTPFLNDVLSTEAGRAAIFVVSWGFHVPKLIQQLRGHRVFYHAHSTGYGFRVPSHVPIMTVSRNSLGYWGQRCPTSPLYCLPNQISPEFTNQGLERDIDVLVQVRKSSHYVLNQLVPTLQNRCNVVLLDRFVDDLAGLFNRSKVYLYDTAEYWAQYNVSEGFGLPPMEAMACGCQVFSSVNGALADYLDPGFNCQTIGNYSTAYDVERILGAIAQPSTPSLSPDFFDPYRAAKLVPRLRHILESVNQFFDHTDQHTSDIPELTSQRLMQLRAQRVLTKLKAKLGM